MFCELEVFISITLILHACVLFRATECACFETGPNILGLWLGNPIHMRQSLCKKIIKDKKIEKLKPLISYLGILMMFCRFN